MASHGPARGYSGTKRVEPAEGCRENAAKATDSDTALITALPIKAPELCLSAAAERGLHLCTCPGQGLVTSSAY